MGDLQIDPSIFSIPVMYFGCIPPEEAPVWIGRCHLWTAGPSSREQEHPESGEERLAGWAHRHVATGRETAGW